MVTLYSIKASIKRFTDTQSSSGIFLFICAVLALIAANSHWSEHYFELQKYKLLQFPLSLWVNDGLMTFFFFLVGLEIKRELAVGELKDPKKASLPIIAALGGMIVPALIYTFFNHNLDSAQGWAIPMATDIAFAIGLLTVFGKKIPSNLKIFLLTLAIVDDIGAILVITFFYTTGLHWVGLLIVMGAGLLVLLCQKYRVRSLIIYFLIGIGMWAGFTYSGIHPTVAGVILGMMTPYHFPRARSCDEMYSPIENLIDRIHPYVGFFIMPVFAFFNAGISLIGLDLKVVTTHPVSLGIFVGLALGKPVGVFGFSRFFTWVKVSRLAPNLNWFHIFAAACLSGIGFTMALFMALIALPHTEILYAKTGILLGSIIASVIGVVFILLSLKKPVEMMTKKN